MRKEHIFRSRPKAGVMSASSSESRNRRSGACLLAAGNALCFVRGEPRKPMEGPNLLCPDKTRRTKHSAR